MGITSRCTGKILAPRSAKRHYGRNRLARFFFKKQVLFLVIIGVIDQDVEHHGPQQLRRVVPLAVALRQAHTAQNARQLETARSNRGTCRNAVNANSCQNIKAAHSNCVWLRKVNQLRLGDGDSSSAKVRPAGSIIGRSIR